MLASPKRLVSATVLVVMLLRAASAVADPLPVPANAPLTWYHVPTSGHLVTEGGTDLRLPPGYFLPEPVWSTLDTEIRRLQDAETRLTAENVSLRKTAEGWAPGWRTVAVALAVGIGAGYLAFHR